MSQAVRVILILIACAASWSCKSISRDVADLVSRGEFGRARALVLENMEDDPSDRNHMLDRLRIGITALCDGVLSAAQVPLEEVYEILRNQGLNDDKTVLVALLNDKVTYWKGEPFEQAMAYLYIAMYHAMDGSWDTARAAADGALFHLKDFGAAPDGHRLTAEDLVRADAAWDQEGKGDFLKQGYRPAESNFALGYLLKGIAELEIRLDEQAREDLAKAVRYAPGLQSVVEILQSGDYDTILVCEYGRAPEKIGTGPDNAIADFAPVWPSDGNPLVVQVEGEPPRSFPVACDLNLLAKDHMWRGLEDIRIAKSYIGTALLAAGAGVGMYAAHKRDEGAAIAALVLALAGIFVKMSAHADTTYCEALPQRVYVAPIRTREGAAITCEVANHPVSRIVLRGVEPPAGPEAGLRLVRMVSTGVHYQPPFWAAAGDLYFCSDAVTVGGDHVPYILGGNCVCTPSYDKVRIMHEHGHFPHIGKAELEELYRAEGIKIEGRDPGIPGLHVLEGGDWLYTPLPGSAGFQRLFGQPWNPYVPRSEALVRARAGAPSYSAPVDDSFVENP